MEVSDPVVGEIKKVDCAVLLGLSLPFVYPKTIFMALSQFCADIHLEARHPAQLKQS